MRISGYIVFGASLLASLPGQANDDKNHILQRLKALQTQGVEQSEKYLYSDMEQLKQCVDESHSFRNEAKELQQTIMKSNDVIFRMPAYQAADLAFQCVYCSETAISYCEKMDKYIQRTEKSIK
ncbi:hypothetical protein [Vibrio sp. SCSIO 43169]|uniref:hypothetical protein n=1 Tax=Vibrio sp. SCSIO 43169 TaxID=2822801 RepID=UPI002042E61F|nr:hypothetical protein [Vibrio sp. SCSIO 43169]MCM5507123.1 hypothetical protein [Vibrio sp. SCSIO 43169]